MIAATNLTATPSPPDAPAAGGAATGAPEHNSSATAHPAAPRRPPGAPAFLAAHFRSQKLWRRDAGGAAACAAAAVGALAREARVLGASGVYVAADTHGGPWYGCPFAPPHRSV